MVFHPEEQIACCDIIGRKVLTHLINCCRNAEQNIPDENDDITDLS
jgi:hypothetical protein